MENTYRTPAAPAAPGPFASFVRFVVCGGGVGVLSSFAVTLLALSMPWGLANAVITVASTVLCTELHARFTFGAGRRADRREHWQSAGSAAVAYVVTCAAMLLLHLIQSSPSALTEQIVYLGASALAGLGRFLVLRLVVFAGGRRGERGGVTGAVREVAQPEREYVVAGVPVGAVVSVGAGDPVGAEAPVGTVVPVCAGGIGQVGSRYGGRTAAVLTAPRLCPPAVPAVRPRPRRQIGRASGSTRNALCRLNGRTARKPRRSRVRIASAA